jgi:putative hydrolase of the HAD superfamily
MPADDPLRYMDGLVFDLDGTLCEYRRPGSDVLAAAFDAVGVEPFFTVGDYYARFEDFVADNDGIEGVRADTFAALARDAGRDPAVARDLAAAYTADRDHANVRWLPGAEAVLSAFADRPLAVVTNGDPSMQGTKLAALGAADRFETVVHAGWEAPSKPDPAPFGIALDAMGVDASRAVTVGNSLHHDVAGAHNAGLRSVWLDRHDEGPAEPVPHHRIESLHELLEAPWQ